VVCFALLADPSSRSSLFKLTRFKALRLGEERGKLWCFGSADMVEVCVKGPA